MKYKPQAEGETIVKKDYSKKIIFSLSDFEEPGHLLQTVTIPSQTRQRIHSHNKQTEVWYVLEGETEITINGKIFLAKRGDAFICPPGDKHNLWNKTDKDFKVLVFKINLPENDEDTNWLEG